MKNISISETIVNATKGHMVCEIPLYETFTGSRARLFRSLQQEYGKCVSGVFVDTAKGTKQVGWVFQKRTQYSDCKEHYIQETWISVKGMHKKPRWA